MSSRVMLRPESGTFSPMVWRNAGAPVPAADRETEPFEPSRSVSSSEVAGLQSQLAELEHAARLQAADSYQKGFREGERRGQTQATAEVQPVLERMAAAVEDLTVLRKQLRREAEADVVQLAIAIAKRILHREIGIDPAAMQALVQVALGRLERQEVYRVTVHPSQEATVKACLARREAPVEVVADGRRDVGVLVFETNRGKLDASVNAQFEEIERGLTDRVNQR